MSSDATVPAGTTAEGREPGVPDSAWSTKPWYKTGLGIGVVTFDIALTAILVLGTMGLFDATISGTLGTSGVAIPVGVYTFSLLGALGFVFTALIETFDSDTARLLRYNLRLPAALPLGAGVFVLSDIILGSASTSPATENLVVGLIFLSGLYVNLAYKRLGALARRLLPDKDSDTPTDTASDGDAPTDTASDGDETTSEGTPQETTPTDDAPVDREPVSVSRSTGEGDDSAESKPEEPKPSN